MPLSAGWPCLTKQKERTIKRLILDIETAPNLAYTWGLWQQNVSLGQLIEPTRMLAVAAKWHGKQKVYFFSEHHDGAESMAQGIHGLINDADAVVHFNGSRFDMPHLRREFVKHGLGPHKPVLEIDLLKVVKSKFKLPSNKLQFVATEFLGLEGKLSHSGFDLWVRCMAGDPKAWAEMKRYNIQDIKVTEAVYDALIPWMHNHPNWRLFTEDGDGCPTCGSASYQKRGFKATQLSLYQQYRCNSCGGWFRGNKALNRTDLRGTA